MDSPPYDLQDPMLLLDLSFLWKDSFSEFECDPTFKFTPPQVPDDWTLVEIIDTYSPTEFWLRTTNNEKRQNDLMDKLNEYYAENDGLHDLQEYVCEGLAVVGFFLNEWHRAEIKSITGNKMELFFVDYGTTVSNMQRFYVKKLHKKFAKDEMLALKAAMWNVRPPDGTSEWSMKSHDFVYLEWGYITVRMKIIKVYNEIPQVEAIFFSEKSSKYKNYFTARYPDRIFNINLLLVEEKLGEWVLPPDPELLMRYRLSATVQQLVSSQSVEPNTRSVEKNTNKLFDAKKTKEVDEPEAEVLASGTCDKSSPKPVLQPFVPILEERWNEIPSPTSVICYQDTPFNMTLPVTRSKATSPLLQQLMDLPGPQKDSTKIQLTSASIEPFEAEPELIGIHYERIFFDSSVPAPRPVGPTTQEKNPNTMLERMADVPRVQEEDIRPKITCKPLEPDPSKRIDESLPLPTIFSENTSLGLTNHRPQEKGTKPGVSFPFSSEWGYALTHSLQERIIEKPNQTENKSFTHFGLMAKNAVVSTAVAYTGGETVIKMKVITHDGQNYVEKENLLEAVSRCPRVWIEERYQRIGLKSLEVRVTTRTHPELWDFLHSSEPRQTQTLGEDDEQEYVLIPLQDATHVCSALDPLLEEHYRENFDKLIKRMQED